MKQSGEIKFYENFLVRKRGWISRWPQKTVFIYSGGLDSTITIAKLLVDKKMEIFPLFVNRGQSNLVFEKKSAYFFEEYFKSKFGKLFHRLKEINVNIPPREIKDSLKKYSSKFGHPLRNTLLQMIGVQYAISLQNGEARIPSVWCAQVPDDPFPHSTLIALRATTIDVCQGLGEWDWQITSPNIDPYLNSKKTGKPENVKWAYEHEIPIERTHSCYTPNEVHCGSCLTCQRRKEAFKKAGVLDKTKYLA